MKFKVNKNGIAEWVDTEAICAEDAIKNVFKTGILIYRNKLGNIEVYDDIDNEQSYAICERRY